MQHLIILGKLLRKWKAAKEEQISGQSKIWASDAFGQCIYDLEKAITEIVSEEAADAHNEQ